MIRRTAAALAIACLLPAAAPPAAAQRGVDGVADGTWTTDCRGAGGEAVCDHLVAESYPDLRGGHNRLVLVVHRSPRCTSLHVVFDREVDLSREVAAVLDGGAPRRFHTGDRLMALARMVDQRRPPDAAPPWVPPEVREVLAMAADGALGPHEASAELVARAGLVKEPMRLGVSCSAAARLMADMARSGTLALDFSVLPRRSGADYHWPALDRRRVEIPLAGLAEALRTTVVAAPGAPSGARAVAAPPPRAPSDG
jgi:hypothetical protein